MTQELLPLNGGLSVIPSSPNVVRREVFSEQFKQVKGLFNRPTEWRQGGRPIYDRLPGASEAYKVDFFGEDQEGYVFIPNEDGYFGPRSLQVISSEDRKTLVIKGGTVVWRYGESNLNPVLINLAAVRMKSVRYLIGYQLYYDDAPFEASYKVDDFSLSGYPLNISDSSDDVVGWRFPGSYAFTDAEDLVWRTRDSYFPAFQQPSTAILEWTSETVSEYSKVVLRCPANFRPTASGTISYGVDSSWVAVMVSQPLSDDQGFYYEFVLEQPSPQTKWKVEWDVQSMAIKNVRVSGVISLLRRPATRTTTCRLVAYPVNTVPDVFVNSEGEEVPVVIAKLAYIDVDRFSQVTKIDDIRSVISQEFKPVSEWLTRPQDDTLKSLFDEVDQFSSLWMGPQDAMKHEFRDLRNSLIAVEDL